MSTDGLACETRYSLYFEPVWRDYGGQCEHSAINRDTIGSDIEAARVTEHRCECVKNCLLLPGRIAHTIQKVDETRFLGFKFIDKIGDGGEPLSTWNVTYRSSTTETEFIVEHWRNL